MLVMLTVAGLAMLRQWSPAGLFFDRLHDLPLVGLCGLLLVVRARSASDRRERAFWGWLAGGFGCWLGVRLFQLTPGSPLYDDPALGFFQDSLYLVFYLCWLVALQLRAEVDATGLESHRLRLVRSLAGAVVATSMLCYFVVVPGVFAVPGYLTNAPSFLLYSFLDVYLAGLAFWRWRRAPDRAWRITLGLLLATTLLWLWSDGSAALVILGVLPESLTARPMLALFQLDFIAVAAASRVFAHPELWATGGSAVSRLSARPWALRIPGGPLVTYIAAVPLVHLALSIGNLVDPATRRPRELLLLVALSALAGLAALYEVLLRAENRRLAEEAQRRQRRAQRLEALGQLAAGIAHDFNNMLTVVRVGAELLRDEIAAEDPAQETVRQIDEASQRGAELVRRLLAFEHRDSSPKAKVDLNALVSELTQTLRRLLPETILLEVEATPIESRVNATPAAVEQIVLNLVTNARDAMPGGGTLRLETRPVELSQERCTEQGWGTPGEYAQLTVSDSGDGMTAEVLERLFDPFFTTKGPDLGTGLGMAMVADLARLARGFVHVQSAPGMGAAISVILPLAGIESGEIEEADLEPEPEPEPAIAEATVLVVEDEEAIRKIASRALSARGHRVLTAADGREGLEVFRKHADEIALVISDVVMPHMTGPQLYQAIAEISPRPFVFMTGYSRLEALAEIGREVPCLLKPWSIPDLIKEVESALATAKVAVPTRK